MKNHRTDLYDIDGLTKLALKVRASDAGLEGILQRLRDEGASPIASMSVLTRVLNISVSQAKDIVWHSATWSDELPSHMATMAKAERLLGTDLSKR